MSAVLFEVACAMLILNCQTKANTKKKMSSGREAVISRKFLFLKLAYCAC